MVREVMAWSAQWTGKPAEAVAVRMGMAEVVPLASLLLRSIIPPANRIPNGGKLNVPRGMYALGLMTLSMVTCCPTL